MQSLSAIQKIRRLHNKSLSRKRPYVCAGQASGRLIPSCPPIWVMSVLFGGPFAAALRLLLQNDSVMELGSKGRIYGELLRLLDVLGEKRKEGKKSMPVAVSGGLRCRVRRPCC